ncbi:altronate dehydratase [Thalassobacillus devorans]|uniref:Altronate dehydratase n=1 Tax=Thalassobacillus devorans TaxID=279813 RepID=A0ABQ1NV53_9BACI|nr:altronate dehydratase family protein [Thalassobacillus devorans]NIK28720.1 altronate hydrolase [Thalassobacillus devorans]GGC84070.1 altronate dehydratase [Thalassobacillus devorans]
MEDFFKINEKDNVVVALHDLKKGTRLVMDQVELELLSDVPKGHKVALSRLDKGDHVIKYGFPIGHVTAPIQQGEWVHTENTKTNLEGVQEYQYQPKFEDNPYPFEGRTFQGFKRKNGEVGVRNELWIVPTVGCVNGIAERIIKIFQSEVGDIAPFDNIQVLKHNYGCSQLGDDHVNTRTILTNAVKHPNAGGILVMGLGCENNNIKEFEASLGDYDEERVKFLLSQEVSNEIEEGVKLLHQIYEAAREDKREEVPLAELKVGLKCGGSDGFSGITANPLLGRFSDYLVAQKGTTVLTEVPEMFGAETILMERARDEEVFEKTVSLINDFKQYFIQHDQPIYENPSPGNKDGGITTLEDKSLGCTQKAGTSVVTDVLKYGETLSTKGLNLLSSPGNDLVASTALGAAGCQIVLFTTGRGTPFGSFVPTMKISTNSELYQNKPHWIDFNAGSLIEGESPDKVLRDFINYIIAVASGEPVNNEKNDFREIAIFKSGVTL